MTIIGPQHTPKANPCFLEHTWRVESQEEKGNITIIVQKCINCPRRRQLELDTSKGL